MNESPSDRDGSAEAADRSVTVTGDVARLYERLASRQATDLDDELIERGLRALDEEDALPDHLQTEQQVIAQLIAILAGREHLLARAADFHHRLTELQMNNASEEERMRQLQAEFRTLQSRRAGGRTEAP